MTSLGTSPQFRLQRWGLTGTVGGTLHQMQETLQQENRGRYLLLSIGRKGPEWATSGVSRASDGRAIFSQLKYKDSS